MSIDNDFTVEFVDKFLFGEGFTVDDYFLRKTPVSETINYIDKNGRRFYLSVGSDVLFEAAVARLVALGVRTIVL